MTAAALVPPPDTTGGSTTVAAGAKTADGGETATTTSSSRARVSSGGSNNSNNSGCSVSFLESSSNSNHNNNTTMMAEDESEVSFGSTNNVMNDEISPLRVTSLNKQNGTPSKDDFISDSSTPHSQQQQQSVMYQSIRTVLSDEVRDDKSFLGTFGSPVSAEDDDESSQVEIVSWTKTLHTPSSLGAAFSPSSMVSSNNNTDSTSNSDKTESRRRHGLGLQLAVDRTRLVNKANRR